MEHIVIYYTKNNLVNKRKIVNNEENVYQFYATKNHKITKVCKEKIINTQDITFKYNILNEIRVNYSTDAEYHCSLYTLSIGFTKLMVIVMNTAKYPELNNLIPYYADTINDQNKKGSLACRNANTCSSIETIKLLLLYGADVHSKTTDGWTPLLMASRY